MSTAARSDHIELLHRVRESFQSALGDNLVGLYVHGSIAFGCFAWERGDIDLIAAVERPLTDARAKQLLGSMLALSLSAPPKGLEMSVVLREHCRAFVYPTPYELHFSPMWIAACRQSRGALIHHPRRTDPDLAAHFTVIRAVGYPLCGAQVEDVFGPVPRAACLDSIWMDVRNACADIADNPVYVALNLCRALAYARDGSVLSKRGGGEWGLLHVPAMYHPILHAALADYAGGEPMRADPDLAPRFAAHMLGEIQLTP